MKLTRRSMIASSTGVVLVCASLLMAAPVFAQGKAGPLGKPDIKSPLPPKGMLKAHPWNGGPLGAAPGAPRVAGAVGSTGLGSAEQAVFGPPPVLNGKEKAATALSHEWEAAGQPMRGLDGSVVYAFGDGEPVVVCAPLKICDIELQRGEQLIPGGLNIGDTARWLVQVIPGSASRPTHIIVKPTDVGLQTDMLVATNRRTYHIKLVSDQSRYMALTKFVYPMEMFKRYQAIQARAKAVAHHLAITEYPAGPVLLASRLDFNYRIKGDAYFRPIRVYNDGVHTIIQLPPEVRNRRAPVLMVVNLNAPSSVGPTAAVNYRLVDNRFIVDSIFHQAVLVSGVGDDAKTVTITLKHSHDGEG